MRRDMISGVDAYRRARTGSKGRSSLKEKNHEIAQYVLPHSHTTGPNVIRVISVGRGGLAMSSLPGLSGDFTGDMDHMAAFRPSWVISLVTQDELDDAGLGEIGTAFQNRGARWLHIPISDYGIPDLQAERIWSDHAQLFKDALDGHGKIMVHCRGGCGRSGMIALRLMIELGECPEDALNRLRAVHPEAVETVTQMEWAALGWQAPTFHRHPV